jgi:glucose/arabinose dehydrogenase
MKMKAIWCVSLCLILAGPAVEAQDEEQSSKDRYEFMGEHGPFIAERVASGLSQPAAIEFLPDGKALVMQRNLGKMTLLDFNSGEQTDIKGLPDMVVFSDAGAHDIELHPGYADNGWIYISYSEGEEVHSTVVFDRIKLDGTTVSERERVFSANAYSENAYHYGARIQFSDGYVYFTVGDRQHRERAQERSTHTGSIIRLQDNGNVPPDNPFVESDEEDGDKPLPEIWSYGHRNPQGLYVHPETGELWSNEHGPRGGDELNLVKRGANYGWPEISFGFEYEGGPIGKGIVKEEGMEQPVWVYVPSIGPSDLVIYDGEAFAQWKGSFLIGSLAMAHLNRLVLREGAVVLEERLTGGFLGRIRSIAVDGDGLIYLGSDSGEIWRLKPK